MKATSLFISLFTFFILSTNANETFELALKLKIGHKFEHQFMMRQEVEQNIQGRIIKTLQANGTTYEMLVEKKQEDDFFLVSCTYKRAQMEIKNTMMTLKYDSANKNTPIPPAAQGMAQLVNKSFTLEISNNGIVRRVKGMEAIIGDMVNKLNSPAEIKAKLKAQFTKSFGNAAIEKIMQQSFKIYPEKKVAIDEKWQSTITVKNLYPITIKNTWTLESINQDKAEINLSSILNSNATFKLNNINCKTQLKGTQNGHITINRQNGFIENS